MAKNSPDCTRAGDGRTIAACVGVDFVNISVNGFRDALVKPQPARLGNGAEARKSYARGQMIMASFRKKQLPCRREQLVHGLGERAPRTSEVQNIRGQHDIKLAAELLRHQATPEQRSCAQRAVTAWGAAAAESIECDVASRSFEHSVRAIGEEHARSPQACCHQPAQPRTTSQLDHAFTAHEGWVRHQISSHEFARSPNRRACAARTH
eukprot:scaffold13326_cov127-Isochrysis_galbana.AAC.2